ncbi:hypothetical protein [Piscinibacter sp. HJYY11]|uniref:hypothetical protein n=1 Tax=Piscinibacter sp. HJYY11 TaxID=2801333 RepID=UPI00191F3DAA|nr:hypothetical protein [Piscinibacter sp. HJYY11]MBL0728642.1 hypothetical protein [Piscinibacter sp. HJYY11]
MDIAQHLHWTLAWVVLPLAALVAASGALRTDLSRPWRQLLACAAGGVTMVLLLRLVRHGLANGALPLSDLAGLHDALLFITLPMLVAGVWKHLRTPTVDPPAPPAPPREALLQQRLDSAEAQEAADKYTRD